MSGEAHTERIHPVDEAQLLRAANFDWRLSRGALGVLASILKRCNTEWTAFPGPKLMAQEANLATRNVKTCLKLLEGLGYIQVIRPGPCRANRYLVLPSPLVPGPDERRARTPSKQNCHGDARRSYPKSDPKLGMPASPDNADGRCANSRIAQLGTQASPDEGGNRVSLPPLGDELGMPASLVKDGKRDSLKPTRDAACTQTRDAGIRQLGMPASHEYAFESTSEYTRAGDADASPSPSLEIEARTPSDRSSDVRSDSPEKAAEKPKPTRAEQICADYRAALASDRQLVRLMEQTHWQILAKHGLVGNEPAAEKAT